MDLTSIKNKSIPVLSSAGVTRSSLFGSIVSGGFNDNSDVDFLIELPRGKTLLDFMDLKEKLEAALGKSVDLVTYKSISPYLKDSILKSQFQLI